MAVVTIIGGGIGGLASAILLGKDGHEVHVYEKNESMGGRASVFSANGYTFDMGPSRYLMPDVFEHFFSLIGEKIEDYLILQPLDPSYRIFFDDGDIVDMASNPQRVGEILEEIEPGAMKNFFDYLDKSEYQYHIGMKFVYKNYDSLFDFLTREIAREGSKLHVFSNLFRYVKRFFKTDKAQKIMMYTLVFLGTSPYQAPALYNIMSHVDFNLGLFYPVGGIYKIIEALLAIGEKYNVTYHTDSPIKAINVVQGMVTSVQTEDNRHIVSDLVVCNADQAWAETTLLAKQRQTYPASYRKKKVFAPSGFMAYLGIDKKMPELLHHNLYFSQNREENFTHIFDEKKKQLPTDPSRYICNPSKTDPSVAPAGKENMFVLVPIPNGITMTTQQVLDYKNKIYTMIEESTGVSFRTNIEYERIFNIHDFEHRYNARQGTALGLAHTLRQTAVFRPNNVSKKVKNLFYVGHTTNPGIGMPMVLISSQLVHERVQNYLSSK